MSRHISEGQSRDTQVTNIQTQSRNYIYEEVAKSIKSTECLLPFSSVNLIFSPLI
jgi:hypothetical protein